MTVETVEPSTTKSRAWFCVIRSEAVALLATAILGGGTASAEPTIFQTDVFVAGESSVHTYRIPAVVTSVKGTLLAFAEARKQSSGDQTPTDLVLKRSLDNGKNWQPMQVVVKGKDREAIMNPTPVIDRTNGAILLLCNLFPDIFTQYKPGAGRQLVLRSTDDGITWSSPLDITEQISDPKYWASLCVGPGVGIQISGGRLVVPSWHFEAGLDGTFVDNLIYSDDGGQTWGKTPLVPGFGDESQVVELSDGSLMLNIRATGGGGCETHHRRKVAISSDGGRSWSKVYLDEALITPCCQGSILRYTRRSDGYTKNRLLFSNPAHTSQRLNMTVRLSYDEGRSWPLARTIHAGPSAYSCLTVLDDDTLGVIYETGKSLYGKIRFARFNLEWLSHGKDRLAKAR